MQAALFFILYPFVLLISYSPFWLLYKISDGLFVLIYYVVRYRKSVVLTNLKNSFPERSNQEIEEVCRKFYRYLCDLVVESLKTITWNEQQARSRVTMHNVEMLDALYAQGRSIIIVMGHLGNWEWAGPGFSLNCKHQLYVVYRPLANPYFEKVFSRARTKFSTKIVVKNNTLRSMVANRKTISATALIADQAPSPIHSALWLEFLHQDTAVFAGPEKIAKKLGYPVVYMQVERVKRGYYEVHPTLLAEHPKETADIEITREFNKILEKGIRKHPETWLWSHKRWKHKRSTTSIAS
ncbi:lysophospholipid acyltransferase family protein [Tunicatimonas pelagia]|uniref:lysophospholipid acyltransferase family protein n=1 Tax=Tunicatimonas pelagia TaxID=931531 RepID=UPI00266643D2|nr:lysophospholipid acyltransferase family protein [Tunicatimonas pelagia]WKN42418.1 lysophospholipid acyltransferase family protein [Tunicatimonas pelagia]